MKIRLLAVLNVTFVAAAISLGLAPSMSFGFPDTKPGATPPAPASPAAAPASDTEDVIYMNDGRELHGQIISENKTQVVFDYKDPRLSIKTKLTLAVDDILHIDRKVALTVAQKPAADDATKSNNPSKPAGSGKAGSDKAGTSEIQRTYGASRVQSDKPNVPSFYIVPVKGQFGTDIIASVYQDVVKDIREHKPTVIIFDVECSDSNERMHPEGYDTPSIPPDELRKYRNRERGLLDFEDYREFVHMFRDGLRDIDQVVWVHDADGVSANIMMAWDQLYMTPSARLGGLITVLQQSGANMWEDENVRAKMMAAWLGIAKSFLEKGHYALQLADAMLNPEFTLSGHWEGRDMKWSLDTNGAYLVDGSDKRTANFRAKSAEDLCISKGTADDLDELALLMGYREYRLIDGKQFEYTTQYVENWRRMFKDTKQWWNDYVQYSGWASGAEAAKWLGKAKQNIEKIIAAMDKYKAIETRWGRDIGISKLDLKALNEKLAEALLALKNRDKGNGGGGNAGGGGRAGSGGGGGRGTPGGG